MFIYKCLCHPSIYIVAVFLFKKKHGYFKKITACVDILVKKYLLYLNIRVRKWSNHKYIFTDLNERDPLVYTLLFFSLKLLNTIVFFSCVSPSFYIILFFFKNRFSVLVLNLLFFFCNKQNIFNVSFLVDINFFSYKVFVNLTVKTFDLKMLFILFNYFMTFLNLS